VGPGVSAEILILLATALVLHFAPERLKALAEESFSRMPPLLQGAVAAGVIGVVGAFAGAASPYYYFQF